MDPIAFITEMLSVPVLRDFISENVPEDVNNLDLIVIELIKVQIFMKNTKFIERYQALDQALIEGVRITAHRVGNFMNEIVRFASKKRSSSSGSHDLVKDWKETLALIVGIVSVGCCLKITKADEGEVLVNEIGAHIISSFDDIKSIENMLLETGDSSNCITPNEEQTRALLLMKAFPALGEIKESSKKLNFFLELSKELDNLPQLICKACEKYAPPLAVILIGSLLSFKKTAYDTWHKVKDDLFKIQKSNSTSATSYPMGPIFTYCYSDLPSFLKPCFLYFACYPIGYEISTTSLIEIWVGEGFVKEGDEESMEETAYKYLEELVQRSLVHVAKRSLLGTIKSCQVHPSIHEFAIKQSYMDKFLVANPDQEEIESLFRFAIHNDTKKQYTEVKNNHIHSFLAFSFDSLNFVLGSVMLLRVLEMRKSTIPVTALPNMISLRYLGLRGSNISEIPENIGDMKNLQTLDVRDTSIETLPESLWNISTLRHVYVNPNPQIKGPPSTANILHLQTLKTVAVHESWEKNIPHFVRQLRKLALSNWDDIDWKSISSLLSHMDKLISMAIMGNIIPSEAADTRAFPNLETVKSIELEGKWICRKLFIDNVKFPPNLTKLILTNSGLKEDPMPTLERLQALKSLSLKDGAYVGKQMVCSTNGFPQLQFLELSKLENLEIWVVGWKALLKLRTLRLVQCRKLNNLPNLHFVTINDIDEDIDD